MSPVSDEALREWGEACIGYARWESWMAERGHGERLPRRGATTSFDEVERGSYEGDRDEEAPR